MHKRTLDFRSLEELLRELDTLHQRGYVVTGNWNLSQICNHCAYFVEGTLNGFEFRVPWLLRVLAGGFLKRRLLATRRMASGGYTPQKVLPTPEQDEATAVARLITSLERLFREPGPFHPSPLFGTMSPDEWRKMHLIHCSHHLGFLVPR